MAFCYPNRKSALTELTLLKFEPQFVYRVWGGYKIRPYLGYDQSDEKVGEAWLLSTVGDYVSVVSEGPFKGATLKYLIDVFGSRLLGNFVLNKFGNMLPILIKLIDANEKLSIQVHPDDILAKRRHNSFGKTEMWYFLETSSDSYVLDGFKKTMSVDEMKKSIKDGSIKDAMNHESPKRGNVYWIPSGRPHAIGPKSFLFEIQQASNITYRIYDYNRVDPKTNKTRELHVHQAIEALDFSNHSNTSISYPKKLGNHNKVVDCPYFHTNYIPFEKKFILNYSRKDVFVILFCIRGTIEITFNDLITVFGQGEVLLIPASASIICLNSDYAELLEVHLPH